jgi:hypothetical protein
MTPNRKNTMDTISSNPRIHKLQQIPVFAMRQMLYDMLPDERQFESVKATIINTLNIQTQDPTATIRYLERERLIRLINACPEIDDLEIDQLFEEYRYGANPSFSVYLFDSALVKRPERLQIQAELQRATELSNQSFQSDELPRVRSLAVDELYEISDHPDILEANYRFQKRLDFVDEQENPTSVYETQYGFFWLNIQAGYAIIHARDNTIQQALELAISEAAGIHLSNLIITKQFKADLPFLLESSLRSSRLHDPDPESDRFRWLSITDDDPYKKGYRQYEQSYPEVRNARYRVEVDDSKDTSLSVQFDRGSMSLAGKLTATQFRNWTLLRLREIIAVFQQYRARPELVVQTVSLRTAPELVRYTAEQKDALIRLTGQLLNLKLEPGLGYRDTGISPLELASLLGPEVLSQYFIECQEPGCELDGYFTCEFCGQAQFSVQKLEDGWQLECRDHRKSKWAAKIPFEGVCENGHPFRISQLDLEQKLEILPGGQLLHTIAELIKRLPGYAFSEEVEGFFIRGMVLYYLPDRSQVPGGVGKQINVFSTIHVGSIQDNATVKGVVMQSDSLDNGS